MFRLCSREDGAEWSLCKIDSVSSNKFAFENWWLLYGGVLAEESEAGAVKAPPGGSKNILN